MVSYACIPVNELMKGKMAIPLMQLIFAGSKNMPKITLQTLIKADLATCFDTSRSIDVHVGSMSKSKEKAIAGTTTGLIGLHETVDVEGQTFRNLVDSHYSYYANGRAK